MIVKTTKDILVESFRELASTKSINKITIKQITNNCGMSPATFYRYFTDKYDLMVYDYTSAMSNIMKKSLEDDISWNDIQKRYISFYDSQRELFMNILKNTSGYDAFIYKMSSVNSEMLKYYLQEKKNMIQIDKYLDMYIHLYSDTICNIVCEWFFDILNLNQNEILDVMNNCMPVPLRKIILDETIL